METSLNVLEFLAKQDKSLTAGEVGKAVWPQFDETKQFEAAISTLGRLRKRELVERRAGPLGFSTDTYTINRAGKFVLNERRAPKGQVFKGAVAEHIRNLSNWAGMLESVGQKEGAAQLRGAALFLEELQVSRLTAVPSAVETLRL